MFLAGCRMAREGHPCPSCFNPDLWTTKGFQEVSVQELFQDICNIGNPYVTFVGGEPLDQYEELAELFRLLDDSHFHICLITHYTMSEIIHFYPEILKYSRTIIDGPYEENQRIFDEKKPGIYHVIGSGNQNIWVKQKDKMWHEADKEGEDLAYAYNFV